jgi:hypothetical protein
MTPRISARYRRKQTSPGSDGGFSWQIPADGEQAFEPQRRARLVIGLVDSVRVKQRDIFGVQLNSGIASEKASI